MKLSYREKIGLLVVIVLAVVIVFIAWPIKNLKNNIKMHTEQRDTIQVDYDRIQREIAEIPIIESNINATYEDSKGLSENFVSHMTNIEFGRYFEELLNKAPYNAKKNNKLALEITGGLGIDNAGVGSVPFYYYVPDVITYPILEAADTNGNLMETSDKALYDKVINASEISSLENQDVEVRYVSIPMKFTKEALLALEEEVKKETGMRITGVTIDDYTFGYVSEIPDDKGYSEGEVSFAFYTMQQIQKPVFD